MRDDALYRKFLVIARRLVVMEMDVTMMHTVANVFNQKLPMLSRVYILDFSALFEIDVVCGLDCVYGVSVNKRFIISKSLL